MKIIGLTGGIASGKSTVLKIIKNDYKIDFFDCDEEAHKLLENSKIKTKIKDVFTDKVFTEGKVDRKKMGKIVFNDSEKLKKLNEIIHPEIKLKINNLKNTTIVDIPLLFEANFVDCFDEIILVYVNEEIQKERLIKRNELDEKEAKKRIGLQMNLDKKKELSNYVIDNSYNLDYTKKQIKNIMEKIMEA